MVETLHNQHDFPMTPDEESPVDRGHLIPHLSGGEFGPNIFRQDRALNRGWSEEGKRYRALERAAAGTLGALYFGHLLYCDDTDYPRYVEIAVLLPGGLSAARRTVRQPPWQAVSARRHRTFGWSLTRPSSPGRARSRMGKWVDVFQCDRPARPAEVESKGAHRR
jgi:hypothetical protein